MIALVDYGAGNLTSVRKALFALGAEVTTPSAPDDVATASGIIVPGVGHFEATATLDQRWRSAIRSAIGRGAALFGICLGMQWLFEGSDEAPQLSGLGIFQGNCVRLEAGGTQKTKIGPAYFLKVPHVGWNSLELSRPTTLMRGVPAHAHVYFTHSYAAPLVSGTAAIAAHGTRFSAAVEDGRVAGAQFHPEKSGDVGLHILRNWLDAR